MKRSVTAPRSKPQESVAPECRLAVREPLEAYDEYTNEMIDLTVGQRDPASIKGLIIDFRYFSRDGETSRRSILCWQCGRVGDRIYVRGYCAFREELRTFRIDRMGDVVAWQGGREVPVDDLHAYFAAYAAEETEQDRKTLRLISHDD